MTFKREYARVPKPLSEMYAVPTGTVCIQVVCPDDDGHIAILQGLLAKLTEASFWQGDPGDNALMAGLWQVAYVDTDWEVCEVPDNVGYKSQITLWHTFCVAYIGAALNRQVDTAQMFASLVSQNPAANGDSRYQVAFLKPGTYSVTMLCVKQSGSGLLHVFAANEDTLYTVDIWNTIDLYSAATVRNNYATTTVTITEEVHRIYFQVAGKNGSSSGYGAFITALSLERTDVP